MKTKKYQCKSIKVNFKFENTDPVARMVGSYRDKNGELAIMVKEVPIINIGYNDVFYPAAIPGAPSTWENSENCKCHSGKTADKVGLEILSEK